MSEGDIQTIATPKQTPLAPVASGGERENLRQEQTENKYATPQFDSFFPRSKGRLDHASARSSRTGRALLSWLLASVLALGAAAIPLVSQAATPTQKSAGVEVTFGSVKVDGLNIAYREAGNPAAPKLVLLHGFPASSHQYRDLVRALGKV